MTTSSSFFKIYFLKAIKDVQRNAKFCCYFVANIAYFWFLIDILLTYNCSECRREGLFDRFSTVYSKCHNPKLWHATQRSGDTGDGTAAQPLAPLRTNSQMRYFRVLSRNLVVTQWRRYLAPLPVISLEVGVNVNNCNKLHSVHADAACKMNINKNVNCCLLL